jgi:hypothetical protein
MQMGHSKSGVTDSSEIMAEAEVSCFRLGMVKRNWIKQTLLQRHEDKQ